MATETLRVVTLHDVVELGPLIGERQAARRREARRIHRGDDERIGAVRGRAAVTEGGRRLVERFAVDPIVVGIAEVLDPRFVVRRAPT